MKEVFYLLFHHITRVDRVNLVGLIWSFCPLFPLCRSAITLHLPENFLGFDKGPRWAAPAACPSYLLLAPEWQPVEKRDLSNTLAMAWIRSPPGHRDKHVSPHAQSCSSFECLLSGKSVELPKVADGLGVGIGGDCMYPWPDSINFGQLTCQYHKE